MIRADTVTIVPELTKTKMKDWRKFWPLAFEERMERYKARIAREKKGKYG